MHDDGRSAGVNDLATLGRAILPGLSHERDGE